MVVVCLGIMERHLGQATFDVGLIWEDLGGENAGECCWNFSIGDLRRVFAQYPKLSLFGTIPEAIGDAVEYGSEDPDTLKEGIEIPESIDDFTDDKIVSVREADSGIVLLAAMGEIGGHWKIEWQGENKTWFFHDWDHARHDTIIGPDGPSITGIDWDTERRAQVNGARDALRNGVSIDDVCEAVVSILEEFERRFRSPIGSIWSDIFEGFQISK